MSERTYEARALAIHYFNWGGLPFVDRQSALAVVVDAEDEIGRLRQQLAESVALLRWALPYVPEPTKDMGSCEFVENYARALQATHKRQ